MSEKWIGDIRGVSGWAAVIFAAIATVVLFVPLPFMSSSLIVRMIIGPLLGIVAFVLALVRLKKQRLLALVTIVAMLGVVIKVAPTYYALYELYMQGEAAMREHRRTIAQEAQKDFSQQGRRYSAGEVADFEIFTLRDVALEEVILPHHNCSEETRERHEIVCFRLTMTITNTSSEPMTIAQYYEPSLILISEKGMKRVGSATSWLIANHGFHLTSLLDDMYGVTNFSEQSGIAYGDDSLLDRSIRPGETVRGSVIYTVSADALPMQSLNYFSHDIHKVPTVIDGYERYDQMLLRRFSLDLR